jgi:two-component system sensor histidine kinase QseC
VRSIRAYLLTRLLGGSALVLSAAGLAAYLAVAQALGAQFDRNLSDRVQGFASLMFQVEDRVEFEFSGELMPEYEGGGQPAYFEVRFADGALLERSTTLRDADLVLQAEPGPQPVHWSAPLPDGRPGRYVARRVEVHHLYPEEGPERPRAATLEVVLAHGRGPLQAAQRRVAAICALASLVLTGMIAALSWRAVERSLEPAGRLASAVSGVRVDPPLRGLDAGAQPRELRPIAATIEELIGRVERALERERRTAADIAHELRTPISELVTTSEVALRNGGDTGVAQEALRTVRDIAWRMGGSMSTLLKLARLEMGSETFAHEQVDLGAIVGAELRSLASVARERGIDVAAGVEPGERVEGDQESVRIVVSNLLSNALHYAPPGGTVDCRLARGEPWRFEVVNDAGGLQPRDLDALCEPFWRKDGSRSDRERSGLGLALSHALAQRTGMDLRFSLERGCFRAVLSGTTTNGAATARA